MTTTSIEKLIIQKRDKKMTTQQATEHSPRFGFVVFTGRHKILDYHQPKKGQQIATADDEDAARMIVRALNEHEELIAALRNIAIPSLRYCEQKYGHDDQARLNLEAVLECAEKHQ